VAAPERSWRKSLLTRSLADAAWPLQVGKVAQQLKRGSALWGLLTSPLAAVGCLAAAALQIKSRL
jgi:hypothetical protein